VIVPFDQQSLRNGQARKDGINTIIFLDDLLNNERKRRLSLNRPSYSIVGSSL
jgi:hypothetical protein